MPRPSAEFDYDVAFSRNLGWVTPWEQQKLRWSRVAIAGMGGVGGYHLLTLARLGVGAAIIADFDHFELGNFNRQAGAAMSTLGRSKVQVMADQARDINPEMKIRVFHAGIDANNLDDFLEGVDLFIDSLDFFVLDMRSRVFARCRERGITAITAAPVGMGVAYIVFPPDGMSFEDYFCLNGFSPDQQQVNMLVGLNPKGLHRTYLVDPFRVDFEGKRAPSTVMGCELCGGVVGTEAVKILLKRGPVPAAPRYRHFDAYRGKWVSGRLHWGNRGPLQSVKRHLGYRMFARLSRETWPADADTAPDSDIHRILALARWAPSGDNSQPWRFEIKGESDLTVHVHSDASDIYDYDDGRPTLISTGMMLETMRIAASRHARRITWSYLGGDHRSHKISVHFQHDWGVTEDRLAPYITIRSVDRRPYRLRRIMDDDKAMLADSLGDDLTVVWHESLAERMRQAQLNMLSTDIRLRTQEAYEIHRRVIDWQNRFSRFGIPARAVGLDALSLKLMAWAMQRWKRVDLLNRFCGGTWLPKLQLDLIPGIFSASHFSLIAGKPFAAADRVTTLIRYGHAIQRFWLTATKLGLVLQPSIAPLIFANYGRYAIPFTKDHRLTTKADTLWQRVRDEYNLHDQEELVFRGRTGYPTGPNHSRSVRQQPAFLTTSQTG